jgi:hypothetical protein
MNQKSGLTSLAGQVRAAGRGRDTVLAHITPEEAALLKARGGRGSTNPVTGLPEFEDEYSYSYDPGPSYSYDPGPSYDYSAPSMDYSYSAPSYDYSYSAPSADYYNPNISIDYSFLNPVSPPTTVTDYYDPGYNYDYSPPSYDYTPAPDYTQPSYDYSTPPSYDYSTPPSYDYSTPPSYDYTTPSVPSYDYSQPSQPDYTGGLLDPNNPPQPPQMYEPSPIEYNDPTASYRYDILGNLSPDAFYRSQFAPEFANEIYSNVNPNFSIDAQGNPDVATGDTTDGINTAPLAGDFVDAQGNLTNQGLNPEVTPTVESDLADLPSENANEAAARLEAMSPETKRAFAARLAMEAAKENAPGSLKGLIDESADAAGTDPRKMYGIVAGESGHRDTYDTNITSKEASYGPFQLNRKGGLGVTFEKETGLDLADPATIPAQTRWVAEYLAQHPNMNVGKTWYGYKGDADWSDKWGNAGLTPPTPPMPMARPTDEQLAIYNPGSEYSAPMPTARPTAEEFAAYGAPPALPPLITGVGQGAEAQLPRGISAFAPTGMTPAAAEAAPAKPESDYLPGQSTMDKVTGAIPGAITDYGLGMINPVYGIPALGMKALSWVTGNNDYKSPGSMLSENLFGGPGSYGNAPKSVAGTEYVPPVEAPAEIGRLPQTAGGTPIVSEPATGPIQVPSLQFASPAGSPSNEVLTGQADETAPTSQDVIDENYSPPFQEPGKQYVLPEELANGSVTDETSFMDYNYPDKAYSLPPSLSRNPDLLPASRGPSPMVSAAPLPSSGGFSSSGGTPSFGGGGGGGGGPSVSVGGGGGGGGSAPRAAAATTGGGSIGTVSASDFGFQGIGGINRDYRSPIVGSGRTVDFGTPSRQLAYDLNLPAIQQAAMNPNSYRSYLSQYKQLFG